MHVLMIPEVKGNLKEIIKHKTVVIIVGKGTRREEKREDVHRTDCKE